jgi:hypothetical protein
LVSRGSIVTNPEFKMGRSVILWLLGVPISAIVLMHLFGVL